MTLQGYLTRDHRVVWRDIAGEVVIVGDDGGTIHELNRTASLIWSLADGTRRIEDIADELCSRFEVTPQQALADAKEFCLELIKAGLLNLSGVPATV